MCNVPSKAVLNPYVPFKTVLEPLLQTLLQALTVALWVVGEGLLLWVEPHNDYLFVYLQIVTITFNRILDFTFKTNNNNMVTIV